MVMIIVMVAGGLTFTGNKHYTPLSIILIVLDLKEAFANTIITGLLLVVCCAW